MTDVTVIGPGPMGLMLAELALKHGKTVTVWNRSAHKAATLVAQGAVLASTPAAAIAASPTTLVCVYDYAAAEEILAGEGVAAALQGRVLINLGTGGPDEVRRIDAIVTGHGGRYLDGAIQTAPSQMGQDDTPIIVSGPRALYAEYEPLLKVLGGSLFHAGEDIDAAAYLDLATLSYVYGAYAGFVHGATIAEKTGSDVATYGRLVRAISPSFGAFFEHQGGVIAAEDFRISESPLRISIAAVNRILRASERLGLNSELPALVDGWLTRADSQGYADEELAALVKVLRSEARTLAAA